MMGAGYREKEDGSDRQTQTALQRGGGKETERGGRGEMERDPWTWKVSWKEMQSRRETRGEGDRERQKEVGTDGERDAETRWQRWRGRERDLHRGRPAETGWGGRQCIPFPGPWGMSRERGCTQRARSAHMATGFPGDSGGKASCLQCKRSGFDPWFGKIPWRRK